MTTAKDATGHMHSQGCPVVKSRGQDPPLESHSLYFEQYGMGPVKLVFVSALMDRLNSWAAQVKHFSRLPQYSILVFDNRGAGISDTPKGPYSSTVIILLDFIGWTESRSVHVVGLSLGGMITQASLSHSPERFISLSLAWFGLKNILSTTRTRWRTQRTSENETRVPFIEDPKRRTPFIVESCFNSSWLDARAENDPTGRTNPEVQIMRLAQISKAIPKVLILTGDQDHYIRPSNSAYLSKHMPEAEFVVWMDTGHAVNMLLERVFLDSEGRERS
ncbi:Alpha/Beta hydrolase protein [Lactarius pseudohatsudake]|nr:Alpha/Beta hydrolase protein [Lactarius pseudohatsudake]